MRPDLSPMGVIHGRFQPPHLDHLRYLLAGKARCRHLVVGVTNPDPSLTRSESADANRDAAQANPLTYFERLTLLRAALPEAGVPESDFTIVPLPINIPELYRYYAPLDAVFYLSIYDDWGRRKRSYFQELGLRVEVLREVAPEDKGLSACTIRQAMLDGEPWEHLVSPAVARLLKDWDLPGRLRAMAGA